LQFIHSITGIRGTYLTHVRVTVVKQQLGYVVLRENQRTENVFEDRSFLYNEAGRDLLIWD